MKASKLERSGDEHYTPEWVVERYLVPFVSNRFCYTPFGQDSIVKRVISRYTTVIDTPSKYGGDFFKAMDDPEFIKFLKSRNACVVDNPPFSQAVKIYRVLHEFDYYLIGGTLSAIRACPENKLQADIATEFSIPIILRVISISELLPVDVSPAKSIIISALCFVKHEATKA